MPITGSQQALMFARSGIMRSGASRSDYYNTLLALTIGGVSRASKVWKYTLKINKALNQDPDIATMRTFGFVPVVGQEVRVGQGAIGNLIFGGHITKISQESIKDASQNIFRVSATDYSWLLGKANVLKRYTATAAHTIFSELATTYASGFTADNVKTGSPTIDEITFTNVPLPQAFSQLADRAGWKWYPGANKDLHFFDAETSQAPRDITTSNFNYDKLDYGKSLDQIRTRTTVVGGGAQATAPVAIGATSIPVDECGWYLGAGGTVESGQQRITYTGRSASSGPGNLTGVPASGAGSIVTALKQGDAVYIVVTADDAAAQTALATATGTDGIWEYVIPNHRVGITEATEIAEADLLLWSLERTDGQYRTRDKFADVGKNLTITLPARSISATVPIVAVEIAYVAHEQFARSVTVDSAARVALADAVRAVIEQKASVM